MTSTAAVETPNKRQFIIAACLDIGQLLIGYVLGWTAPIIPKLQHSDQTPLPYVLTDSEASWVGSVLYFGGITGPYVSGYLSNVIGRRPCIFLGSFICCVGFLMLGLANNVALIYTGRILTGASNGIMFITNLVYIGEMASTHIRGTLLTQTGFFTSFGTLLVYAIGPFVSYQMTCWLAASTALIYLFLIVLVVPETPLYQVMKGQKEKALLNLIQLGRKKDLAMIEAAASKQPESNMAQLEEMFTIKANKRALVIIITLNISQQMSGFIAVLFFVTTIFNLTGSSLESHISTIIVGATQVIASTVTPFFVDRTGRKSLLLVSTSGCGVSIFSLGVYFYFYNTKNPIVDSLQWLSLSSLILFFIFFNFGFGIIPSTLFGEMFTSNVRSFGSSFTVTVGWLFGFGVATAFGYMVPAFGAHVTFWIYAFACAFAFVFTLLFVPETKGKSLLEIQEMLSK